MSSFPGVFERLQRLTTAEWCTWVACALAVLCVLLVVLVPLGGTNRVAESAVPFAIGAVALGGNYFAWRYSLWGGVALIALGGLAVAYGIFLTLSVPLRLAIQGTCPLAVSPCPLGYDHPLTGSENVAVYVVTIVGAVALILVFAAVEVRHIRPRPPNRRQDGPAA